MLSRTRVGTGMDTSRLGEAVSRPGIDPRMWKSLAIAVADSMVDPNGAGVFVDVMLMPSEQMATARVGSEYAGSGWGLYAPIYEDDELEVSIPSGHQAEGLIVSKRLWSAADSPPTQAMNEPKDLLLVVQKDSNFRIIMQGGGKLNLGSENPTDAAILGTTFRNQQSQMDQTVAEQLLEAATDLEAANAQLIVAGAALTAGGPQIIMLPSAGVQVSAAGAAITAATAQITEVVLALQEASQAITQFESGDPNNQSYLSETAFVAVKNDD
jgi:hypothetical protein